MNERHMTFLVSDEWRARLQETLIPFALGSCQWGDLGADVLEIGPGPGLTTDVLHTKVPQLTAIELDGALATKLRDRLAGSNVEVVEGDATAMPFEDGRFSSAITFTMLHHVPSTEQQRDVFRQVHRTLAPGGLFIANDSLRNDELEAAHEGDIYNPVDPQQLVGWLEEIGFVDIEARTLERTWACHARRPA